MKIYPVEGRTVRDPHTREPVPVGGRTVSDFDPFWARRLRDGDVTKTPPKATTPEPTAAPTEAATPETTAQTSAQESAPAQEDKS